MIARWKENCGFGLIANIDGEPSHKVVRTAILGLSRMQHRGAILSDGKTGDGCGLLLQMPKTFFQAVAAEAGFTLAQNFAVGQIFLPQDEALAQEYIDIINEELINETLGIAVTMCGERAGARLDCGGRYAENQAGVYQCAQRLAHSGYRATLVCGAPPHSTHRAR